MRLYGASGHAKVIIDILQLNNIKITRIYDDAAPFEILGYQVEKPFEGLESEQDALIISIGRNSTRKFLTEQIKNQKYGLAIHPKAILDKTVQIQEGSVIMGAVVINSSTQIGKHCIINTAASIDHDCIIENFAHISPNATLCGNVRVGEGTQIGAGATVIPNIRIGKWCTIGANSVVIKDVPDNTILVGNPARIINK